MTHARTLTVLSTSVIPLPLPCKVCEWTIPKASVVHWVCLTDDRHELEPMIWAVHTGCMGEAE